MLFYSLNNKFTKFSKEISEQSQKKKYPFLFSLLRSMFLSFFLSYFVPSSFLAYFFFSSFLLSSSFFLLPFFLSSLPFSFFLKQGKLKKKNAKKRKKSLTPAHPEKQKKLRCVRERRNSKVKNNNQIFRIGS